MLQARRRLTGISKTVNDALFAYFKNVRNKYFPILKTGLFNKQILISKIVKYIQFEP